MEKVERRTVTYSKTTITELMIPSYANFGGKIHGGILLSLIDKVAYACASKHAGAYCVTVSIDNVEFLQPVEVGELVSLHASVNYVGNTSLVIGIKVIAENVKIGLVKHTNTSYVTMVAKGDDDRPTPVPALVLETKEEVRRFVEAMKRKELKLSFNEKMDETKNALDLEGELGFLKGQRCWIRLDEKGATS
ncbi:MAG: acyl-CoA thioesterase [Cytophagales bacterium]|nr:acyl-CoA thioesterase [Cytophagales bacterium]